MVTMYVSALLLKALPVLFGASLTRCQPDNSQILATTSKPMDASDIKWAHAVNSRVKLDEQLAGDVDFLEADISMGHIAGKPLGPPFPIMAHPPDIISDISLENWLDIIIARMTGIGVKLDFKSIEAVQPSLMILQGHERKINFPLWLNADILSGPVDSLTIPVDAAEFLKLCDEYFPNATLSVGWTTSWFPTISMDSWYYDWRQVRAMVDTLNCPASKSSRKSRLTFPVRAIFACRSIPQLQWLLRMFPEATLTVWSSPYDKVVLEDLLRLRTSFHASRVYYDIPNPLYIEFQQSKNNHTVDDEESTPATLKWWAMTYDKTNMPCISATYADKRTLFFGKGVASTVLYKDVFQVPASSRLQVKGIVQFFKSEEENILKPSEKHELVFSLAEVHLFNKKTVSVSGNGDYTDVVWHALNSSRLYAFRQESSLLPLSYYFKLDTTSQNETFQVWKLTPQFLLDDLTEENILKHGTPQISKNMKLVLPSEPVMLGFVSSGSGEVVVHGLHVEGAITTNPKSSSVIKSSSSDIAGMSSLLIIMLIIFFTITI